MKSNSIDIRAEHKDIGATMATTIYVGETKVISYRARTSHFYRAEEVAEEVIAKVLRQLIEPIVSDEYRYGIIENLEDLNEY